MLPTKPLNTAGGACAGGKRAHGGPLGPLPRGPEGPPLTEPFMGVIM